ncbi:MAG: LacI family DNA-binding transcriptional regulator [Christensenella sp.]|uniref:LacI family DNA-binding transcriptional regulator n=1 Tax=Christensenella sp. TaxID=1935934 RepID=UPI002B200558|nr:LacI family DNA-binding transcriptional regulator [Christensenella sp.]MEA5002577.1 LacI family DNA-binding transcriptional regulator [Christensenella sp.]
MTNIQKVAKHANVSVATVSRVINGAGNVTPKTKQRVEQAIAELNYVPNMLARNFRTSKSKSILVILSNISNLFYMEIVHGISKYANECGYDILLSETDDIPERQIECLEKVKNRIADGAVLLESIVYDKALLSMEKSYPIVQCCTDNDEIPLPYVMADNVKGGYLATRELIEKGHRKLAFVGTDDQSKYNRERCEGFLKAVHEAGIEEKDVVIDYTELSLKGGRMAVKNLLEKKVEGVFFASDMQAIGAIQYLRNRGVGVPEDIAIVGYDNLEMCDIIEPPLTSIDQHAWEMGRESARILIERIEDRHTQGNRHVVFQPELVRRKSV